MAPRCRGHAETADPKNRRPQKQKTPKNRRPQKPADPQKDGNINIYSRARLEIPTASWPSRQPAPLLPSATHTQGGGKKPHSAPEIRRWERTHAPKGQVYRKILLSSIHAPVSKLKVTYKRVTYTGGGDIYKWSWGGPKGDAERGQHRSGEGGVGAAREQGELVEIPPSTGVCPWGNMQAGSPKGHRVPQDVPHGSSFLAGLALTSTLCSLSPLLRVFGGVSPPPRYAIWGFGAFFSCCISIGTAMGTTPPLPSGFFVPQNLTQPKSRLQRGPGIIWGAKRDGSGGQKHGGDPAEGQQQGTEPRAPGRAAEPCWERGSAASQPRDRNPPLFFFLSS